MRRLSRQEKVAFKRSRWLLLKNPWNLNDEQKERLSTLVRWNAPIVRAYYLKEAFQMFWDYRQPKRAENHFEKWMRRPCVRGWIPSRDSCVCYAGTSMGFWHGPGTASPAAPSRE
jgi:hypothetical protein